MPRIVHLGIGNFHRAHQAWYTQRSNALNDQPWHITGVSLRSASVRDALRSQDFSYTLVIKSSLGSDFETMSVHDRVIVAPENPKDVIAAIADPETAIVTLTITEKGYCIDAATSGLDLNDDDVRTELESGTPKTAIGYLVHGLSARQSAHEEPLTVICCDNLTNNGRQLERLVREYAEKAGISLEFVGTDRLSFPCTMVDRIVPATTSDLKNEVQKSTGIADAAPVATEAFSEWVIEDRFVGPRPAWDQVGARIVDDVAPFELRKLRLLNGSHSLLAYAGLLSGHSYVHEAIVDPGVRSLVLRWIQVATGTLPGGASNEISNYCDALIQRFENPSLQHKLSQIAMDGSLKIKVRILPVLKAAGAQDDPIAAMAVAFWVAYVAHQLTADQPLDDPSRSIFDALLRESDGPADFVSSLVANLDVGASENSIIKYSQKILTHQDKFIHQNV